MFVWTCTKKLWQTCRDFVSKNTKNTPKFHKRWIYILSNKFVFFFIKSDSSATENAILTTLAKTFLEESTDMQLRFRKLRKRLWIFRKENNILRKWLCTCKMQLWPPCWKSLVKTLKTICSNSGNDEKIVHFFQIKILLLKMFVRTCTMRFCQACRIFVVRNTKNFPEFQNCWKYNFLNKIFLFIRNVSLATENGILTTTKKSFLRNTLGFAAEVPKNDERIYEFFERRIFFLKFCFCTCRM